MKRNYEDREALQTYLDEMAKIPRLTADEEREAARRLMTTSRRLRLCLLSCDFVLHKAARLFERLERRELRLDYTIGFPTNDSTKRQRVAECMPIVRADIRHTLGDNRSRFALAMKRSLPLDQRLRLWRGMPACRRRAIAGVNRIGFRTRRLQRWQRQLEALGTEMQWLGRKVKCLREVADDDKLRDARCRLHALMRQTSHSPATIRRHIDRCQRLEREYDAARHRLVSGNLRLVVAIAHQHRGRGVSVLDLIQEGNSGLLQAVDRWSPEGGKFSSYAIWWVRQAINDAVNLQPRMIRLPEREGVRLRRILAAARQLAQTDGHWPDLAVIAERAGFSVKQTERTLRFYNNPLSLDRPLNCEAETVGGELLADHREDPRAVEMAHQQLKVQLLDVLTRLNDRQRTVISLRFGLVDGCQRTLEEVGKLLSLTREGVRQIELRAIERLRRPTCSRALRDFAPG